jgi:hypothetical protein
MASFMLSHFSYVLFPQLSSRGSVDVPVLLAEVTQAWGTATAAEATRAVAMLTAGTSAQEVVAARDSTPSMLRMQRTEQLWWRGRHWRGYRQQR